MDVRINSTAVRQTKNYRPKITALGSKTSALWVKNNRTRTHSHKKADAKTTKYCHLSTRVRIVESVFWL